MENEWDEIGMITSRKLIGSESVDACTEAAVQHKGSALRITRR